MIATLRANLLASALGLLAAVLLAISVYQHVQIHGFLWVKGLNDKLEDCARDRNELRAITQKKNEQAKRTKGTVEQADRGNREADERAKRVEDAPLPGDCRTPDEVMRAGI